MDQRKCNFPTSLTSERLVIRRPESGDGKVICDAINASINELRPWMLFAQEEPSVKDMENSIREAQVNFENGNDFWALIFTKETEQFVGATGLHQPNWIIPKFNIGYWVDTRYSGQGYITEAVQALADYAINQLKARRLEIRGDALNTKSIALPVRLGFTREATLINDRVSVDSNEIRDTFVYVKLA